MPPSTLDWAYFPRSAKPTALTLEVVKVFATAHPAFDSDSHQLPSNSVLRHVGPGLAKLGFAVEVGKKNADKVSVPVLYGNNGRVARSFDADAYYQAEGFVVEIEAGRAVANNQFLKDLFQACMMDRVEYLAIAVRRTYEGGGRSSADFDRVVSFFETLYASRRLTLPLSGILLIGY